MKDYEKEFYDKDFHDKDECCEKKDWYDKKEDKKKKQEVAIACGQVCDDCVDILSCNGKCQIATLELNLKNFKKPVVKLDFSSIVKFRDLDAGLLGIVTGDMTSAANASFTLKLYRLSDCCQKICVGTWEFTRFYNDYAFREVGLFLAKTKDSFCFTKCDHPECEECVTYILEVHDTTCEDNILTKLVMTQINFNAIAVEEC